MISLHPNKSNYFYSDRLQSAPYFSKIFSCKCSKEKLKRHLNNRKTRQIIFPVSIIICILVYIFGFKIPYEKNIKAAQVTLQITSVLGTRLTAVRLLPDINTTRLQPTFLCDNDLFSIILIKSTPDKYWKRQILRKTWFKFLPQLNEKVKAFFFLSVPAASDITMNLTYESEAFNDIIIEDMGEHPYLQTLKSLRMLKWFNSSRSCLKARYLIKTDDDSFLHIPNIIKHINSVPNAWINYIGGELHLDDSVVSDPDAKKFAPSDWWPEQTYPPYVTGPLIVISSETVPHILSKSLTVPVFHLDDVFIFGIVAFEQCQFNLNNIPRIEFDNPQWWVRVKIALAFRDLVKTNLAFYCAADTDFIEELYNMSIS